MGYSEQPSTEMLALADGWYAEGRHMFAHYVDHLREQIKHMTEGDDEKEAEATRRLMMVDFADTVDTMIEAVAGQGQFQDPISGQMAPPEVVEMIRGGIRKQLSQLTAFAMFHAATGEPVEDETTAEVNQLNELFAWDGTDDSDES